VSDAAAPARRNCAKSERCGPGRGGDAKGAARRAWLQPLALGPPPIPDRTRRLNWASLLKSVLQAREGDCVHPQRPAGSAGPREARGRRHGAPIAKARARPHQEHFDLHPDEPGVNPLCLDCCRAHICFAPRSSRPGGTRRDATGFMYLHRPIAAGSATISSFPPWVAPG
jgi:hypothetical protein